MKKIAILIIIACYHLSSIANPAISGNITFRYSGVPNQFNITMTLYRDCSSISLSPTDTICVRSVNCNYTTYVVLTDTSVSQVGQCFNMINFGPTTCVGGNNFGVEKHTYTGVLILPFACDDWELSYSKYCGVILAPLFSYTRIVIKTTFDNLNFPSNSSPAFSSDPCFDACVNTGLCYSMAASDIDGDSVIYFEPIIDTSAYGMCPQIYAPYPNLLYNILPYSQLDSITGLFCFNVPYVMWGIVPYAMADKAGNLIKSTTYSYSHLSISNNNICTTGINEISNAVYFTLSPNSTNSYIQLSFVKTPPANSAINIYNVVGEKLMSQKVNDRTKVAISVAELQSGIYLVEVVHGNTKQIARFVKQ